MNEFIQWSPGVTLEHVEKQVILMAFRFYRGNKTATANALGIAIRTLDNKLEKYEGDGKAEKERLDNERARKSEILDRQRNGHAGKAQIAANGATIGAFERADSPAARQSEPKALANAEQGIRMEPAAIASEKPALSMPERQKVQSVLPQQASQGGPRKNR